MEMQNIAFSLAGLIGAGTAILHGIVTRKLLVRPLDRHLADSSNRSPIIRRIVPPLLQYSTYSWLVGGIALIVTANAADFATRLATGLLVGSMFLYGAVANLWATRGRHPGWLLMAIACGLIAYGLLSAAPA